MSPFPQPGAATASTVVQHTPSQPSTPGSNELKNLSKCYTLVSERRLHYEVLLWQVPALTLTGQAFLFTIALAPTATVAARTIAMVLSMLISYLTAGTFAKHSLMENADRLWLKYAEERLFTNKQIFGDKFEWVPNGPAHIDAAWGEGRTDIWRATILKRQAYGNKWMVYNWIWGIRVMLIGAGAIIIISAVKPAWLNG